MMNEMKATVYCILTVRKKITIMKRTKPASLESLKWVSVPFPCTPVLASSSTTVFIQSLVQVLIQDIWIIDQV